MIENMQDALAVIADRAKQRDEAQAENHRLQTELDEARTALGAAVELVAQLLYLERRKEDARCPPWSELTDKEQADWLAIARAGVNPKAPTDG